ncbi:MAG: amino acid permease [Pyrinomonadaceae bacterium]
MEEVSWDNRFRKWLMQGVSGDNASHEEHKQHAWWKVMCLTGVDYFSTLGYQPGIAFLAAGALSPIATIVLVALTLFGALPIYRRVAAESPHGQGSISMLEQLFSRWRAKLFVLVLLGFVATDFVITITLSAADATAHIIENPFFKGHLPGISHSVVITLALITLLGAVFLKGFKEAINLAVVLVTIYLAMNVVIVVWGTFHVLTHPTLLSDWKTALFHYQENGVTMTRSVLMIVGMSLIVFPKLALGLSGFETGVAVMPIVKRPNRIGNTRKLLFTAALIMSIMLILSSFVTSIVIPAAEFEEGGRANGRALAFLAHEHFGDYFGSVYDLSTILILWFAGASAMAGLLNIVPRYLPRYGMAPEWARANRPLVFVFVAICFAITIFFQANVDAQGGAYATGVLVLMTSAAVAVAISAFRRKEKAGYAYSIIALIFLYTTGANVIERPDGLRIASLFILAIVIVSFISRALRTTEIRIEKVEFDETAEKFLEKIGDREVRIITNRREFGTEEEYEFNEKEKRTDNHIPAIEPILFFEVETGDASEFKGKLKVRGVKVGHARVLRTESPAVPNAIAALLLAIRDRTNRTPHVYFGWSEENPLKHLFRYVLFGEGDTAPVTREILRKAEPDPELRPSVHVGG